jgi:hypothetical protein
MKKKKTLLGLSTVILVLAWPISRAQESGTPTTSTEWRNDEANLAVVRELNRAYARLPFSREFEGVLDDRPLELEWTTGTNLPMTWKGGAAGIMGDEIALAGGQWNPGAKNLAYVYNTKTQTYKEIVPPPFKPNYSQGTGDGKYLYLISGRGWKSGGDGGRNAAKLGRSADGSWQWTALPPLPESEAAGRWQGGVAVIPGKWLFLVTGYPGSSHSDWTKQDEGPPLRNWRLRLDDSRAQWQPMAPYPPAKKLFWLPHCGVARDKLYIFGGVEKDHVIWEVAEKLGSQFKLSRIVPYWGIPFFRDAYRYDPETDRWTPIRRLPMALAGGNGWIVLQDRYILLMGNADAFGITRRVGKSVGDDRTSYWPGWQGYNDLIVCYDVEKDNYSRLGVMPYGLGSVSWVTDGTKIYGFGGEPHHFWNKNNTENVLQIGTIRWQK